MLEFVGDICYFIQLLLNFQKNIAINFLNNLSFSVICVWPQRYDKKTKYYNNLHNKFNRINLFDNTAWQTGMFYETQRPIQVYKKKILCSAVCQNKTYTEKVPIEPCGKLMENMP